MRDCRNCLNAQGAVAIELDDNNQRHLEAQVTEDQVFERIAVACGQAFTELAEVHPDINVDCALGVWGVLEEESRTTLEVPQNA